MSCLSSTFDLSLYNSVHLVGPKPTRHLTKTLHASTCMSLDKSWLDEQDGVCMAGVWPKVDTELRSPTTNTLPCPNANIDGLARSVCWRFVGCFGNGVT